MHGGWSVWPPDGTRHVGAWRARSDWRIHSEHQIDWPQQQYLSAGRRPSTNHYQWNVAWSRVLQGPSRLGRLSATKWPLAAPDHWYWDEWKTPDKQFRRQANFRVNSPWAVVALQDWSWHSRQSFARGILRLLRSGRESCVSCISRAKRRYCWLALLSAS